MIARSYTLTIEALADWIGAARDAVQPQWWLVSTVTSTVLARSLPDLAATTEGRAFGTNGELKWRVDEATAYCIAVAADATQLPDSPVGDLELDGDGAMIWADLWGEWDASRNGWYEGRFAGPLLYEVDGERDGQRVQVAARRLLNGDGEALEVFAGVRLAPEEDVA